MMNIDYYEIKILNILIKNSRSWLNTTQIANKGEISWNTAMKYLKKMYDSGWISQKKNYWRITKL